MTYEEIKSLVAADDRTIRRWLRAHGLRMTPQAFRRAVLAQVNAELAARKGR